MAPPRTPSHKMKATTATTEDPPNGQIRSGVWHCNCSPPLPAVQFTVRKETKNKGRSFYTCQKKNDKANKCDFFLWSEDARLREVGAVFSNSRSGGPSAAAKKQTTLHTAITPRAERRDITEKTPISRVADLGFGGAGGSSKGKGMSTTPSAGSSTLKASTNSDDLPPPPLEDLDTDLSTDAEDELVRMTDATSVTTTPAAPPTATGTSTGSKRKREGEDYDEFSDFSSGEEEQLAAIVDRSGKKREAAPAFTTPAIGAAGRTQNVIDLTGGMPTPLTEKPVRRVLFSAGTTPADSASTEVATPSSSSGSGSTTKRQRINEGGDFRPSPSPPTAAATTTTPTPATPGGSTVGDITQEVMGLLRQSQTKLEDSVLQEVRKALDRHAAKARGLERGRDASRLAAKRAETRAAELQERVADLENRRLMDAENRRKMRSQLMKVYEDS